MHTLRPVGGRNSIQISPTSRFWRRTPTVRLISRSWSNLPLFSPTLILYGVHRPYCKCNFFSSLVFGVRQPYACCTPLFVTKTYVLCGVQRTPIPRKFTRVTLEMQRTLGVHTILLHFSGISKRHNHLNWFSIFVGVHGAYAHCSSSGHSPPYVF